MRRGLWPSARVLTTAAACAVFAFVPATGGAASKNQTAALSGTWSTKAPMTLRSFAMAGVIDGKLYVAGGVPVGGGATNVLQVYDPATDTWATKAPMPTSRATGGAAVIDGKLYVVGGWLNSDSNTPTNVLEVYDPATDTWQTRAPMPTSRGATSVGAIAGKLYVTGGRGPVFLGQYAQLDVYDPSTNSWTTGAPLPTTTEDAASAVVAGKLYVIGGNRLIAGSHQRTAIVQAYDAATNSWTSLASMPSARGHLAAGVIGTTIHVVGGTSTTSGALATHEDYDVVTDTWASDDAMPTARRVPVAGVIGGTMYVAGGDDNSGPVGTNEAFTPGASLPSPLIVNSSADAADLVPGDGVCLTAASTCTLRAAVQEANARTGADTITFSSSTNGQPITLTIAGGGEDAAATGDLDVTTAGGELTVTGNGPPNTIIQGCDPDANPDCTGADRIFDVMDATTLNLNNLLVRKGSEVFGGAIRVGILLPWNGSPGKATLNVDSSKLVANSATSGGAVYTTWGVVNFTGGGIHFNRASNDGGAVSSGQGTINITHTAISGNHSDHEGGAIFNNSGSAVADVTITGSSITGNSAENGGGVYDNGYADAGTFRISNSTFSGNSATQRGAAVFNSNGVVKLASVTLSDNSAGGGGAIHSDLNNYSSSAPVTLKNTIVASSTGPNCTTRTIIAGTATITSQGYSLSDDNSCGFTGTGDLEGVDPQLASLANNGGLTMTHALYSGSPAINAGDPAGCTDTEGAALATDQRGTGFPRVVGPRCDIGAFEGSVPAPQPPNVVTNTNDSGPNSLRGAINYTNGNPGPDTIHFNIPTSDPGFNGQWFTIRPTSALPVVSDGGTSIDGSTQTAFGGDTNPAGPEIELAGTAAPGAAGVRIWTSDSAVDSLAVNSFSDSAIQLHGARNVVRHSYIGTDATGVIAGNVGTGIAVCCSATPVDNQVVDNLVRGNRPGMVIQADRTIVRGNRVELSGPQPAPAGCGLGGGIFVNGVDNVIGGPTPGDRNVVSLNGNGGILLEGGSGTIVQGNYVGTDPTGTVAAGNHCVGIVLEGSLTTNARIVDNLVSGNAQFGIAVGNGAGTVIKGNRVGTSADGGAAVGNSGGGIALFSSNTTVGGPNSSDRNLISGNGGGGVQVCGFPSCSVSGITVQGNRIGTNADGTAAIPNFSGVVFFNTTASAITGNVISGGGDGINLKPGTSGVNVRGNLIGTTADGNTALGNLFGVQIGGSNNTIGGTLAADRNVIAGAAAAGVALNDTATGNTIQGNYVGTNAAGTAALPNATGVGIRGSNNKIGGSAAGAGNAIAFNSGGGVVVFSGTGNAVSRNSIFSNAGLGIDLMGDGVTPNDAGDVDSGPNLFMNFPDLKNANRDPVGNQTIANGSIDTQNPDTVVIEFFANNAGDPSGHGEGKTFLGSVTPKANGKFSAKLPLLPAGTVISATATDSNGNTSEFAGNVAVK